MGEWCSLRALGQALNPEVQLFLFVTIRCKRGVKIISCTDSVPGVRGAGKWVQRRNGRERNGRKAPGTAALAVAIPVGKRQHPVSTDVC